MRLIRLGDHYLAPRRLLLFALEAVLLWLAFVLAASAVSVACHESNPSTTPWQIIGAWLACGAGVAAAFELGLYLHDLHDVGIALADASRQKRTRQALGLGLVLIGLAMALSLWPAARPLAAWMTGLGATAVVALCGRAVLPYLDRCGTLRERVFLIGEGPIARCLLRELSGDAAVEVVGFGGLRAQRISERARSLGATTVVVAGDDANELPSVELLKCRSIGIDVVSPATLATRVLHRLPVDLVRPADLIYHDGFACPPWLPALRRLLSLCTGVALAALLWPVTLLAAVLVRLDSPGPVLFRQTRIGRRGQPFTIYKLRTMRIDAEAHGARWAQAQDPRITRIGRHLRRFRVDELPQLWNVLRGDMDLIGPRPERPEFVAELRQSIPYYDLRHLVTPGITGYAQVLCPYGASVEEARQKLQYDLYYVRHLSLMLDLYVLLRTVKVVLFGRGAR